VNDRRDADAEARRRMLEAIRAEAAATARWTGRSAFSEAVMAALAEVPRHRFVPEHLRAHAYDNAPLPIGGGQTISQPYIVALMTDLLDLAPGARVLEVGTGSGYQAAVLSRIAGEVYSVETLPDLARAAQARLAELGYANVFMKVGDGYHGWPEHAPYDAVMVTAAVPAVPEPLLAQLRPGGRMVLPVDVAAGQELILLEKAEDGGVRRRDILPVAFVPLTGSHGRERA